MRRHPAPKGVNLMYIHYIRIQNYRNFKDVEMTFHDKANYLVGENAIGKSGFLRLLKLMSEGSGITENDYADPDVPLIITVRRAGLARFPE